MLLLPPGALAPLNITAPAPAAAWTCPARPAANVTVSASLVGEVTGDHVTVDPRCAKSGFDAAAKVVTFVCPNMAASSAFAITVSKDGAC